MQYNYKLFLQFEAKIIVRRAKENLKLLFKLGGTNKTH
jgi:hypothetical protein